MALEYIVQPQVFLGGLTALGPGIFGLTEQYPLLTTYQSWTSTASVPASTFPIPGYWSIYDGPNKEGSFIVTVGGVVQPPGHYTIDHILRTLTFDTMVSADIEVAVTQLATASPSSQDFSFVKSISALITNLSAINGDFDKLKVSSLTALSSILQVTDILISETSGFAIIADSPVEALKISQTGTGQALLILNDNIPNYIPFAVNNKGQIISGSLSAFDTNASLQIVAVSSNSVGTAIDLRRTTDDNLGSVIRLGKARGTLDGPISLSSEDVIGSIDFYGHDQVQYRNTAFITVNTDGNPGADIIPSRLTFATRSNSVGASATERMRITSDGLVGIGTQAPNENLTVIGDISATRLLQASAIAIGTPVPNQQLTVVGNISATGNIITSSSVSATGNVLVQGNITNAGNITSLGNFVNSGNVTTTNVFGNLDGTVQIKNQSIPTRDLREFFTLKAAVDRSLRTIFVVTSGSGYTTTPVISVSPPTQSWGRQATAVAVMSGTALSAVIVTDVGSGYTRTPTVTVSGGGGTGASVVALADGNPLGEQLDSLGFCPGHNNSVVLGNDGFLYAWGSNLWGNIGLEARSATNFPVSRVPYSMTSFSSLPLSANSITYIPRFVKFWRSFQNLYALDQTGALWSAGANATGQTGTNLAAAAAAVGTVRRHLTRINPIFFNNRPIIDFAVSEGTNDTGTTCLARTIDNDVFGWGFTGSNALGINVNTGTVTSIPSATRLLTVNNQNPTLTAAKVEQIYSFGTGDGSMTFLVLSGVPGGDRQVWAAGRHTAAGNLGIGSSVTNNPTFSAVRISRPGVGFVPLTGIQFIASTGSATANGRTTYFLDSNRTLFAAGTNITGEFGQGTVGSTTASGGVSASILSATPIEFMRCGSIYGTTADTTNYVYAYGTDGRLWAWGTNNTGQLGNDTTTRIGSPAVILSAQNDVESANAQTSTRYLLASGANGITWPPGSIVDITTHAGSTGILRSDGRVFVVGYQAAGSNPKLGTGDGEQKTVLTRVPDFPNPVRYLAITAATTWGAAAAGHMIAVLSDGSIYATGRNTERQVNSMATGDFLGWVPVNLPSPAQNTYI